MSRPTINVPLPAGKLGLSFTGTGEVIVSSVKEGGAMDGRPIKPGYIVISVILGNGDEEEINSKKQLVNVLNSNSEDDSRVLKLVMSFKDEIEVTLPRAKDLGFVIGENKGRPTIMSVKSSCSLKSKLSMGMIVNKISIGDYEMIGYDASTVKKLVDSTGAIEGRKLTLLKPTLDMSERTINFESKIVEIPSGTLGIKLGAGTASIDEIDPNSPLAGIIFPGMAIQALRVPNGTQYDDMSGMLLQKALIETSQLEGRLINLISAEDVEAQIEPTLKVFPPALGGSLKELNFSMENINDDELVVKDVEAFSEMYNILPQGLKLHSYTYADVGKPEQKSTPSSVEEMEDLLLKSSGCDRYFVFCGLENAYMPDQVVIELPPGKLGVVFKGKPPRLSRIKDDSPLIGTAAMPGMAVSEVTIDGEYKSFSTTLELTEILTANSSSAGRVITIVNPNKM